MSEYINQNVSQTMANDKIAENLIKKLSRSLYPYYTNLFITHAKYPFYDLDLHVSLNRRG